MKIAVIGGGSTYTPELIEGFADRPQLGVDELWLYDIDWERLQIVGGLAQRILNRLGFRGKLTLSTDLDDTVRGAAAVLIQLRVGGQAARLTDEVLPNQLGLLGQETTGPGGFFKALRTVPVVLHIADRVRTLAGPDCWIIDFTNPVGINTRALLDAGHKAMGLCNVAIGFQRRFAAHFDVDPDKVQLDHAGLNHLTWIRSVMVDGQERLPDLLDAPDAEEFIGHQYRFGFDCVRALGAIPSSYLNYYYATDEAIAKEMRSYRAAEVMRIEHELLEMYKDPALDYKPKLLEQRGGAWYSTAAAALATSLLTGDGARHYVNIRNEGRLPGLPDESVVEVPAVVDCDGAHPVPIMPLAPEMLGLVQAATAYEVLAIQAAISGDKTVAKRALLANPLVRQWHRASAVFDLMAPVNERYLPAFFPDCACGQL